MPDTADGKAPAEGLRIAAAGDIHCREANRDRVLESFEKLRGEVDLVLLAGDLTSIGTVEEAAIACEAASLADAPTFAVLGNHDWEADAGEEIAALLREAGVCVLEREAVVRQIAGIEVGVVGAKGFVGGFAPRHLPDFGEPSLRALYDETGAEVEAIDAGLREVANCPVRIVLLHYSPLEATLEGEPREIFVFLGCDRLAAPIVEHDPDLVFHGHAHAGTEAGQIGQVPVYNVSQPVLGRDFKTITFAVERRHSPIP
jgi:uncharacterized protein